MENGPSCHSKQGVTYQNCFGFSQDWNCFPPTEQGICSGPLELGARPGCCLRNEACLWALPSSHLLVFHRAGPAHPCHSSPSPCTSVVIWGVGSAGLMNGERLPSSQVPGSGSAADQTAPEPPSTPQSHYVCRCHSGETLGKLQFWCFWQEWSTGWFSN